MDHISKLSHTLNGLTWKLLMSLNGFHQSSYLKYVIKAHQSLKIPLNTSHAWWGKHPKIKLLKKGQLKHFHFKLILTLGKCEKWYLVNMAWTFFSTIQSSKALWTINTLCNNFILYVKVVVTIIRLFDLYDQNINQTVQIQLRKPSKIRLPKE